MEIKSGIILTAFDKFKADYPETFDVTTLKPLREYNHYLENRLWAAFNAGAVAARADAIEGAKRDIIKTLFPHD